MREKMAWFPGGLTPAALYFDKKLPVNSLAIPKIETIMTCDEQRLLHFHR
jgi:hypothetical protein